MQEVLLTYIIKNPRLEIFFITNFLEQFKIHNKIKKKLQRFSLKQTNPPGWCSSVD